MEGSNYRYNVRDPITHRFTRLNTGRPAMTIDHETQQPVDTTNVPASLNLYEDQSMLREAATRFVDGIVNMSTLAKNQDELMKRIESLESRLGEATEARDKAIADAAVAKQDAEMARQAYDEANRKRKQAEDDGHQLALRHAELMAAHDMLKDNYNAQGEALATTINLLTIARDERDQFRLETGEQRRLKEEAEAKALELEEIKEKLATTVEALDICAGNVADWKASATEKVGKINTLTLENQGLHHKVNALEDDNKRQAEVIERLQHKVVSVRHVLSD